MIRELPRAKDVVIAGEVGFKRREFRFRADRLPNFFLEIAAH